MADQDIVFAGMGRLNEHQRSALATRVHVAGRRSLPWNLGPAERRHIHALGLASLERVDERGSLASLLTPEGIALGEILIMRGVTPLQVPPRPWD